MKNKVLVILAFVAVILLLFSFYVIVNVGKTAETTNWGATLYVKELVEKPTTFFVLENPDSYILEAISNLEEPVYLHYFNNTQIDEMITANGTNNIEYNDHYYNVALLYSDPYYPIISKEYVIVLVMAWVFWAFAVFVTVAYFRVNKRKARKVAENSEKS